VVLMVGVGRGGGIDTEVCVAEDIMTVELVETALSNE
jgi:hypothetical protein